MDEENVFLISCLGIVSTNSLLIHLIKKYIFFIHGFPKTQLNRERVGGHNDSGNNFFFGEDGTINAHHLDVRMTW